MDGCGATADLSAETRASTNRPSTVCPRRVNPVPLALITTVVSCGVPRPPHVVSIVTDRTLDWPCAPMGGKDTGDEDEKLKTTQP